MTSTMNATIEAFGNEIEVNVEYCITGRYRAATMEDPAEYPECEITSITDEEGNEYIDSLPSDVIEGLEEDAFQHAEDNHDECSTCTSRHRCGGDC